MASSNVCWGVEVGAGGLKALKLAREGESLRVLEFVEVPHARPLSAPDVDEADAIRVAVGTLASQHAMTGDAIAISAPGQAGFVRFAKLPPTEPKQVANVVKFEAAQQIPFPLEDVEWAYQKFVSDDDPDIEVGIFAITRERVMDRLAVWEELKVEPGILALSPIAAFNAIAYDHDFTNEMPGTVILDIGTTATDLIVVDHGRVWIRTFPMGGHNFTEALVNSFKIDYAKADRLKREAERRKEKRHIFQAMKPVYSDFAQDVQRSLAYYKQLHPDSELKRMIGLGSTFKLMGLRKFLSQSLQMDVERCEKFNKLSVDGPEAADFQSSALSFATAYGCALQGLGLASIDANLVPTSVVRATVWRKKTPWVATAAVVSIIAGAAGFLRPVLDGQAVETAKTSPAMNNVSAAERLGRAQKSAWEEAASTVTIGFRAENVRRLLDRREVMSDLLADVRSMLASGGVDPSEPIGAPDSWRGMSLHSMTVNYRTPTGSDAKGPQATPLGGAPASSSSQDDRGRRGRGSDRENAGGGARATFGAIDVTLEIDATNSGQRAFIDGTVLKWLSENAEREGAAYTLSGPGIDEVGVTTVRAGQSAENADAGDDRERGRGTQASGGQAEVQDSKAIADLAPLPPAPSAFPPGATVQRYTVTFTATLKGVDATRHGMGEEATQASATGATGAQES